MASISHDARTGRRVVQFVAQDGKRKSLRLGRVTQRQAEMVRARVEDLVAAKTTGHAPSDETSRWVAGLSDVLRQRLGAVGLIDAPERVTLKPYLDRYMTGRSDSTNR